jgi:glutamate synthase domain-containing protein 3
MSTRPLNSGAQPVAIALKGYVGQGLGFGLVDGIHLELTGYANDSVGEAMSGGVISVRQPPEVSGEARATASVIGNAACYGATGGKLFVEGRAGQRLGVRNSGAIMVTEGAGKYAFEYMTGGVGVVLGPVGAVIGSGMTGGVVWIYDAEGQTGVPGAPQEVGERLHKESVVPMVPSAEELADLRALVEEHLAQTGSPRAQAILADWDSAKLRFVRVVPAGAEVQTVVSTAAVGKLVDLRT